MKILTVTICFFFFLLLKQVGLQFLFLAPKDSSPGFLNSSSIDILEQIILCWEGLLCAL